MRLMRIGRSLLWALMIVIAGAMWVGAQQKTVLVLRIDGAIGPATADFVHRALDKAQAQGARLVVLAMDTPGGLDTAMRSIIKDILASPIPVATFVSPEGARAASAGTYILYASHIAAMAPATNLGAATPVAIGAPGTPSSPPRDDKPTKRTDDKSGKGQKGADKDDDSSRDEGGDESGPRDAMSAKAINDAAAYIRSLAQLRGRNADFAEQAVRRARSMSAKEAKDAGVIDLIADDLPALLKQLEGRNVGLAAGSVKLDLAGAATQTVEPDWRTKLLALLSNPTVAVLLMMIGIYGLFVEFTSPGFGVPGVAGAISLLLALYAFHLLPVNWAGVALLLLGAALMIAEVFLPTFGVIGVGGIIAFILGGLLLIEPESPGFGIPLGFVIGIALSSALAIIGFGGFALRARKRPVVSGKEEMVGAVGTVLAADAGEVWAQIHGERWRVRGTEPLAPGDQVCVTGVDGLTLEVQREGGIGRAES